MHNLHTWWQLSWVSSYSGRGHTVSHKPLLNLFSQNIVPDRSRHRKIGRNRQWSGSNRQRWRNSILHALPSSERRRKYRSDKHCLVVNDVENHRKLQFHRDRIVGNDANSKVMKQRSETAWSTVQNFNRYNLKDATKCSNTMWIRTKLESVWRKTVHRQRDNDLRVWLSNRLSWAVKVVVRSMETLWHFSHSHFRSSFKMTRSLVASLSLYRAACAGSIPHSTKNRVKLGTWQTGSCCNSCGGSWATWSNFAWILASRILVFIHVLTDWMVAPFGPSLSSKSAASRTRRLLAWSTADNVGLPKFNFFWNGFGGGVGVKILGSVLDAVCTNGECRGGHGIWRMLSWEWWCLVLPLLGLLLYLQLHHREVILVWRTFPSG